MSKCDVEVCVKKKKEKKKKCRNCKENGVHFVDTGHLAH